MWPVLAIPLTAVTFYLIIPAVGMVQVRRRWRRFRAAVVRAVTLPRLDNESVRTIPGDRSDGTSRTFWFRGRLESIGKNDTVWLERDGFSVCLDLHKTSIVLLPSPPGIGDDLPDETPRTVSWRELTALVEGTRFFVSGTVAVMDGAVHFVSTDEHRPFVMVYDGPVSTLAARALWTGRQRNEYWNHLTPISLIGGFLALLLLGIAVLEESRVMSLSAAVLATVPVLPLLPPGVAGFYLYRRIWRRARRIRARRDLIGLPELINAGSATTRYVQQTESADGDDTIITVRPGCESPGRGVDQWEVWTPHGAAGEILPGLRRPAITACNVSSLNVRAYAMEFGGLFLFMAGLAINAYIAAVAIVLVLL